MVEHKFKLNSANEMDIENKVSQYLIEICETGEVFLITFSGNNSDPIRYNLLDKDLRIVFTIGKEYKSELIGKFLLNFGLSINEILIYTVDSFYYAIEKLINQ